MLVSSDSLCCSLLIFVSLVLYSRCTDIGCKDWDLSGQDIRCKKCHPGNRLVKEYGRDPKFLCTPCKPNTYTTGAISYSCLRCTQCIGPQFIVKNCTTSSDTVCGCKKHYRCGDEKCSYCVTECQIGEEPDDLRSCRKCPEGSFNDKIHSTCKNWRKSCPDGQFLKKTGNASKDHECISGNEISIADGVDNTKVNTKAKIPLDNNLPVGTTNNDDIKWISVAVAGAVAMLAVLCVTACVISYVKARKKSEKPKINTSKEVSELSEDSGIIVEQEACSFHHPEQEQGGSSESISTQDSETKLLV